MVCDVERVLEAIELLYVPLVRPYSTVELDEVSVFHVMTALLIPEMDEMEEMVGGVGGWVLFTVIFTTVEVA